MTGPVGGAEDQHGKSSEVLDPATLQKILSSAGLFLDLIGASMLAVEVFRRFRGIRLVAPQTYHELTSAPKESDEYKTWEQTNFRYHFWGLILLALGFLLQLASNWASELYALVINSKIVVWGLF
jgi:hypothetical protein